MKTCASPAREIDADDSSDRWPRRPWQNDPCESALRVSTATDSQEKSRGIHHSPWVRTMAITRWQRIVVRRRPGHEKLLKTMLSGIGCADGVLMVISAFEGMQPQTIEHMNACRVLGIERMVVAVTLLTA